MMDATIKLLDGCHLYVKKSCQKVFFLLIVYVCLELSGCALFPLQMLKIRIGFIHLKLVEIHLDLFNIHRLCTFVGDRLHFNENLKILVLDRVQSIGNAFYACF